MALKILSTGWAIVWHSLEVFVDEASDSLEVFVGASSDVIGMVVILSGYLAVAFTAVSRSCPRAWCVPQGQRRARSAAPPANPVASRRVELGRAPQALPADSSPGGDMLL